MSIRKTLRKNKTKQVINWPSVDTYFTIDDLIGINQHMITQSGLDITIRVRLQKAIQEENLVAEIGQKNLGKGRPKLVFVMRPIKQSVVDKASADGISVSMSKVMNVVEISSQPTVSTTPVVNIIAKTTVNA